MGFVGLNLAAFLASRKVRTVGIEINKDILTSLNAGKPQFYERGLESMVKSTLKSKNLIFSGNVEDILGSDIVFVCVGTPSLHDGSIDLSALKKVSEKIGKTMSVDSRWRLIVIKSTVTPGTTSNIVLPILESSSSKKCGKDFGLVMNPEFLREGSAVKDTKIPHLIVIGGANTKDNTFLRSFYSTIYGRALPKVMITSPTTAEMIKYANNAFLATKISFINSIANICQHLPGTDVEQIAQAIGYDPRIGPLFLKAGPGYGGSCFPKDVSALLSFCKNMGIDPKLVSATHQVNLNQPYEVVRLVERALNGILGKVISILGLAFKKNTDDIREAVSIKIISHLLKNGAIVKVHDPMAINRVKSVFGNSIEYFDKADQCIKNSECCLILTEWDEYKDLKPELFIKVMTSPIIIDARRVLDAEEFEKKTQYFAIGRGK